MRRAAVSPTGEANGFRRSPNDATNGGIGSMDDPDAKSRRKRCLISRGMIAIDLKQVQLCALPFLLFAPLLFLNDHSGGMAVSTSEVTERFFANDSPPNTGEHTIARLGMRGDRSGIRHFLLKQPRVVAIVNSNGSGSQSRRGLDGVIHPDDGNWENEMGWSSQRRIGLDEQSIMQTQGQKEALLDSDDYEHKARDPLYEGDCEPMHPWQEALHPSCLLLHETGMAHAVSDYVVHKNGQKMATFGKINSGGYNDIFCVTVDHQYEEVVLKILGFETKHTDRNYDRVRRDAIISDRLTRSRFVVDVFGHCGLSQLAPLGKGGTLDDVIYEDIDTDIKLKLSMQAAAGLADAHNIDGDGVSSISQGDLKADQYLMVDGVYKLGDFNRGRFIRRNKKTGDPCPYTIGHNDAKYRSPEEYRYDPETSKIDVWALGSILFTILTGEGVWRGITEKKAQKRIKGGEHPPLAKKWKQSTDPVDMLLRKVMYEMCFVPDPTKRSSAVEVGDFLKAESKKLGFDFGF